MPRASRAAALSCAALVALAALAASPARALESELESGVAGVPACRAVRGDPLVLVPAVAEARTGKPDEKLTRSLRWRPLLVGRALKGLERDAQGATCTPYSGADAAFDQFERLAASARAAALEETRRFASVNVSFKVAWDTVPLSGLESELSGFSLKPGPFARTCRPPELSDALFVPAPGQAVSAKEKKAFADLAAQAQALRRNQRLLAADFKRLLDALDGQDCSELDHQFYALVSQLRWAYLNHRDRALGRLMRARLKWRPLP